MDNQTIVDYVKQRYEQMNTAGTDWTTMIEDVAKFVAPSKKYIRTWANPSQDVLDGNLYDTTAIQSNDVLAAGSLAYMTPLSEVWFAAMPPTALNEDDDAKTVYAQISEIMREEIGRSNFYLESHEVLLDRGWAGTSAMHCEMRENGDLWFKHLDAGHFYIAEDNYGIVDTVAQCVKMSARQAVMQFGIDHVSEKVKKVVTENDGKKLDEMRDYIHLTFPRPDSWRKKNDNGESLQDAENKPIADIYIDKDDKILCKNGGFEEMPIFVTRFEKMRGEVYGISPAMKCLPTIRELNFLSANLAAQGEKAVFPPMIVYDNMEGSLDVSAKGINVVDSNRPDTYPRELQTFSQYNVGVELQKSMKEIVKAAFYVDMFQTFTDSTKRMATFEAMQLADEKLVLFHPSEARYYTEFIGPMLQRIFALLLRAKKFPPFPPSVISYAQSMGSANAIIPQIVYQSKIALAVQAVRMKSTYQLLQLLPTVSAMDQGVTSNFDFDKMTRGMARTLNVPTEYIRDERTVKQMRDAQAQQAQAQQILASAQQGAAAAKDAASAGLLGRQEG